MKKIILSILSLCMITALLPCVNTQAYTTEQENFNRSEIKEVVEYDGEKVIFYKLEGDGVLFDFYNKNGTKDEYYKISGNLYKKVGDDYEFIGKITPPYKLRNINDTFRNAIPVGWSAGQKVIGDEVIELPSKGTALNYASILAGCLNLAVSVGLALAGEIIDYNNVEEVKEVYIDYIPIYYNYCSILEGKTDISVYHANRNDGVYSRGGNIVRDMVGGWCWTDDPQLFTSPAVCRQYVGEYPYPNGAF